MFNYYLISIRYSLLLWWCCRILEMLKLSTKKKKKIRGWRFLSSSLFLTSSFNIFKTNLYSYQVIFFIVSVVGSVIQMKGLKSTENFDCISLSILRLFLSILYFTFVCVEKILWRADSVVSSTRSHDLTSTLESVHSLTHLKKTLDLGWNTTCSHRARVLLTTPCGK